jgi:succinate dehydrogenase subunit C
MNVQSPRRPYLRPMAGWWRRNPFFVEYMVHEATALFVAAYAAVLLVGLLRLAQGEAAWNGFLDALRTPLSIGFHVVLLAAIGYHCWTWFVIMPKTLPPILVGGRRLTPAAITGGGLAVAALASLALFGIVWGMAR